MVAERGFATASMCGMTMPTDKDAAAARAVLEVTTPPRGSLDQTSDAAIIAGSKLAIAASRKLLASFMPSVGLGLER